MSFKQRAISSLSGKPLKLVDKFTYFSGNILSTESDVDTCLAKAETAIDLLLIICKSNLPNKIFKKIALNKSWKQLYGHLPSIS